MDKEKTMTKKSTKEEFIKKAQSIHGESYNYSQVDYTGTNNKVAIICAHHGPFLQTPNIHTRKINPCGCPKCADEIKGPRKKTLEEFVEMARSVHGEKYDYSETEYFLAHEPVRIICPGHGVFYQAPHFHTRKINPCGCPKCGNSAKGNGSRLSRETFVERAKKIHGEKYDYSSVKYTRIGEKVEIICPDHGLFLQRPSDHIQQRSGCPGCAHGKSGIEDELQEELLKDYPGEKILRRYWDLISSPSTERKLQLDFYFPDASLAVELNGNYWHSEKFKGRNGLLVKTLECEKKGVTLLHFYEDEWRSKRNAVLAKVKHSLGVSPWRVYARECEVVEVNRKEKEEFYERYHVQGNGRCNVCYGLKADGQLVACMSFSRCVERGGTHPGAEWDLSRYATSVTAVGGASRLLRRFERDFSPKSVVSYADRRHSNGSLYGTLGFELAGVAKPDYFYVHPDENYLLRENKRKYQRAFLHRNLESFDPSLTEEQNMKNHGFLRLWDCGKLKYLKTY
jgi:hypothetical protein